MLSLNQFLKIPHHCLLERKIPKVFFKRNFDLTRGEIALLEGSNTIETIDWLASIAPANSNINSFRENDTLFEEIQILTVKCVNDDFNSATLKIADLIQKHIPYPIILCVYNEDLMVFNACDKKINLNDHSKRAVECSYFTKEIKANGLDDCDNSFLKSLNFGDLDKTNLKTLFESYVTRIISMAVSKESGRYVPRIHARALEEWAALKAIEQLRSEIRSIEVRARKETQIRLQIEMNTLVQKKRTEIENLKKFITVI